MMLWIGTRHRMTARSSDVQILCHILHELIFFKKIYKSDDR